MRQGSPTRVPPTSRRKNTELKTGSSAPSSESVPIEAAIGSQVRALRTKLDLTAGDLAEMAGLSPGMLSKIENGAISPSLATLEALAGALNVSITALFARFEERRDCSFVPAGRGVLIERRGTKAGHQYELLGHSIAGDVVVEPYLIRLSSKAQPYPYFRHAGIEFIHMLTGAVDYRHADQVYPLRPGDSLLFDAAAAHGPERLVELPTTFLSIITYSRVT
jgi:transcriptional regulator with XRE-family HTH domain